MLEHLDQTFGSRAGSLPAAAMRTRRAARERRSAPDWFVAGGRGRLAGMAIATINPATGETVRTFDPMGAPEIEDRLARAADTFTGFRRTSFAQRAEWMRAAARILDDEADDIARMMTIEMGKTRKAARAEVAKCATAARFYADNAEAFLADEPADA
jgi:acyl-CoA reductase-like NAD-dependent aldehyde dehydrogenase